MSLVQVLALSVSEKIIIRRAGSPARWVRTPPRVLHAAFTTRFDAITRDRNVLDSNTEHHAAKQEKVNIRQAVAIDMLCTENAELRAKISAVEATVARLDLAPPAPIRSRSRSPEHHAFNTCPCPPLPRMYQAPRDTRASSQSAETPREAKRQRYSEPDDPPMITPLPVHFDVGSLHAAIPNHFRDAKPYRVERDPVISHNLHVSLQTASQVKAFTSAWAVNNVLGYRNIKMYTARASNESVSHTRPQYRSQRGGHQGQFTSYKL
ncbi:hypothetical protein C8J57DRAFT_1239637 [Mycena rebaudengoi]|nr:hypothetical protein C8J57DRAFT_1239637 [Mycena rebaudengoi]